ncbi:MAG TPA: hypothetical protein VK730_11580 [Solirubrobacteraceae bacterium]|nr:hypothetical protein [Solirubrobacteraceae bacterium]
MNRPASYTAGRAVLAIAGAGATLAVGGCGGVSGATKQTVASKQTIAAKTAEAPASSNKLLATVSTTGGEATLADSGGRTITSLRSGWYTILVTVNAAGADFHLAGPSVDSATKAKVPGVALWGIHLLKGTYRYMNDHDARTTTHVLSVY